MFRYEPKSYIDGRDFGPEVRLGWDSLGLLLWADVTDDAGVTAPDTQLYMGDCVELFVGRERGAENYTHVIFAPGGKRRGRISHFHFHRTALPPDAETPVRLAADRNKTGYRLEVHIPWQTLAIDKPESGEFALQVQVVDADPGEKPLRMPWFPRMDTYTNPKSMFCARLVDSTTMATIVGARPRRDTLSRLGLELHAPSRLCGKAVTAHVGNNTVGRAKLNKAYGKCGGNLLFFKPVALGSVVRFTVGGDTVGYYVLTDTLVGRDLKESERTFTGEPLWPDSIPDRIIRHTVPETLWNRGWRANRAGLNRAVKNVQAPQMVWYVPEKDQPRTDVAVLIVPGGGLSKIAFENLGIETARALNRYGITAAVVKYRTLPLGRDIDSTMFQAILADCKRAVRILRHRAPHLGVDRQKIGVMGGSAGGSLVTALALDPTGGEGNKPDAVDSVDCRPNFICNLYGHGPYRTELLESFPPTFIAHAVDDPTVDPLASVSFVRDLIKAGVTAEAHFYSKGGHGFAIDPPGASVSIWLESFVAWLHDLGVLSGMRIGDMACPPSHDTKL
ncbi:MAG: alpha/beta hydrolase fold domain-containing protein [Chitinivibrionales bacterium]|nr:alpha/beta hydrolase fold domain-containing protein [Chitinivibrionales bacterium]MBD3355712.1 alpha/beta hydrolase fold domain-containing protein [Chitinivibrionales bacterium]